MPVVSGRPWQRGVKSGLRALLNEMRPDSESEGALVDLARPPSSRRPRKGTRELARLQEAITPIQDNYSKDHLHLTWLKRYVVKVLANDRVGRYLVQQPT
jgi:hypothetical protein